MDSKEFPEQQTQNWGEQSYQCRKVPGWGGRGLVETIASLRLPLPSLPDAVRRTTGQDVHPCKSSLGDLELLQRRRGGDSSAPLD